MPLVIDCAFEHSAYPSYGIEMSAGVLQKKLTEKLTEIKRNSLYKEFKKAMKDYNEGKVKTGTVSDLFNSIK